MSMVIDKNNPMYGKKHTQKAKDKIAQSRKDYTKEKHPSWKGGRRKNHNGYIETLNSGHHRSRGNGYVFEHILIAEEKIGRKIYVDEHVHHINEIKTDNRPENLEVLTHRDHTLITAKGRRKGKYLNCETCRVEFYVKPSRVKKARFCSHKCNALTSFNKDKRG